MGRVRRVAQRYRLGWRALVFLDGSVVATKTAIVESFAAGETVTVEFEADSTL